MRHLQPRKGAEALIFGKVYHVFHETYRKQTKLGLPKEKRMEEALKEGIKAWAKEMSFGYIIDTDDFRTLDNCHIAFLKYFDTFPDDIEPIEVEHYFSEPLITSGDYDISLQVKLIV